MAQATDTAGNVEAASATNTETVVVDNVTIDPPSNVTSTPSSPTNAITVTINGDETDAAATTIVLTDNGNLVGTATVSNGTFSFANVALSEGPNVFSLVAEDSFGGQSAATTLTVEDNTVTPSSLITSPANNALEAGSFTVSGVCSASNGATVSSVAVTDNGKLVSGVVVTQTGGGSCTFSVAIAYGGAVEACAAHNFVSQATDSTGNVQSVASETTISTVVNNVAPAQPSNLVSLPASPTSLDAVTISGTAPCGAATVTITGGGIGSGTLQVSTFGGGTVCSCSGLSNFTIPNVPLSNQAGSDTVNPFNLTDSDGVGNTSAATDFLVTQDSTPPSIVSVTVGAIAEDDIPSLRGPASRRSVRYRAATATAAWW